VPAWSNVVVPKRIVNVPDPTTDVMSSKRRLAIVCARANALTSTVCTPLRALLVAVALTADGLLEVAVLISRLDASPRAFAFVRNASIVFLTAPYAETFASISAFFAVIRASVASRSDAMILSIRSEVSRPEPMPRDWMEAIAPL
jgi:hypothetical protein